MSKVVDERVVQMQFDNSNFEKNVAKTLKTLDHLKWTLKDPDFMGNNFKELNKAANNVDMSGLSKGIETVQTKFSALQVMGVTALANLTNSAVNAGKKIASALTDSLINGGRERSQKIKDAKFQIEGLLGEEEYAKQWARIDESINYAVADTAYGYDSAARAASQFLASSVKVGDEMDRSLRAISGVAAMTNSTYDDVSNIFTRIAGQGRVMAIDLNSLASRGLNAAAILGKSMGKTESEIRDMVSDGKISFRQFADAMDNAFGEHAKKGNETFSGALANMKAAMSRIGAKLWDPLIDNERDVFNQMRLLINDLNNNYLNDAINSFNSKMNNIFGNIIKFFEQGGVKNIVLSIGDAFNYLSSVLKPIGDAFREIFPPIAVETLVEYTKKLKELTSNFKLSEKTANNIKNTFKGLFSILDIGVSAIGAIVKGLGHLLGALTGISGGVVGVTGAFGNWVTGVRDTIKESNIFSNIVEGIVNILEKVTDKIKDFTSNLDIFGGMVNGLKAVFGFIAQLGKEIGTFFGEVFKSGSLEKGFDALNTFFSGGIIIGIVKFVNQLNKVAQNFKELSGNLFGQTSSVLYNLGQTLASLQYSIKASAIMEIAKALLVLGAAIFLIGSANPDTLGKSLTTLGIGLAGLVSALWLLSKFNMDIKGALKIMVLESILSSLAFSLIKLSVALKILSTINIAQMGTALLGLTVGLGELIAALWLMPKERDISDSTKALRKLSTSILIFAAALKIMSTIPWPNILWGLGAMTVALTEMVIVMRTMPSYKKDDKIPSMIKMATSLVILAGALKILSTMDWDDIARTMTAIGGTFTMLIAFVKLLPKDLKQLNSKINALNMMALGLGFTALALMGLGAMNWEQIKVALAGLGGSLAEVLVFLALLPKDATSKVGGLIGFSSALVILAGAMKILGSLSWGALAVSLVAMAGAFIVMGVAAKVLGPMIPTLLGLAAAMAVFGAAVGLFGAGVALVGVGIATLAGAFATGTTAIVAGISAIILGVANLAPQLIEIFGRTIETLCGVIVTTAPMIAETILVVISEILKSLANHGPEIIDSLFTFVIGILHALRDRAPEFITAAMETINAILGGVLEGLKNLNPDAILPAILSLTLITIVVKSLAGLGKILPQAMLGVLALGVLIAELGLVLAAIGALSKIPGLTELVQSGGNFLQAVGTAIGQFIGGIVGGVALGYSASMPMIADNLSEFMTNIMPFINGAKTIDMSVLAGITALTLAIAELSAANWIASLTEFLTIGSSLPDLGNQLSDFMNNIQGFISGAASIDPKVANNMTSLAGAILAITAANMINNISNFMSMFTGGNSLGEFANELTDLGTGLNQFVSNLGTFGDDQINTVNCATDALIAISQAASQIPNSGGLAAFFAGDNDIATYAMKLPILGMGMSMFARSLGNFGEEQVTAIRAAGEAIKAISEAAAGIPNTGGLVALFTGDNDISTFAMKLPIVGWGLSQFSSKLEGINVEIIKAGATAIKELATAADGIPNSGGLVALFTGDNDISMFAAKLPIVGWGLSQFASKLDGINIEALKGGAEAISLLANAATGIPNSGGLGSLFTGDNDISMFAMKLPIVGAGLKLFADKLEGFGKDQIESTTAAVEVIKKMIEVTNGIPNSGGLVSLFTGDNDISLFAMKLPIVGMALSAFVKSIQGISTDQVETAGAAANIIKELANAASQIPNTGGLVSLFTGDNDISLFAWKLPDVGTNLGQFIKNLSDAGFDSTKIDLAKGAVEVLAALASVNVPETGGLKQLFTGENDISMFASKLPDVATHLAKFINNLAKGEFNPDKLQVVNAAVEALKALAKLGEIDLKTYGGNIEEFGNKLSTFATKITEFLNNMSAANSKGITDSINKVNQIVEMAKTLSSEVVSNLSTFTDSLSKIGTDGVQAFVNAFTNNQPKDDIVNAINNIIQSVIDKANSRKGDIENTAKDVANAGVNGLRTVATGQDVVYIGKFFVEGFANGINNNKYLARDAGSAVGKAALSAAKQAIDSDSPSKETYKLGTFFDQGFVNGIISLRNKVYDSSYSVGSYAKDALNRSLMRIADIIDNNIDVNPSIRPVMDLSDIENGAAAIDSLLSTTHSVGLMNNLNAISYGMRNRQNGNDDVISAIDKLGKSLGNSRGDTYSINGITYDDGSNIKEAVETLVRAAKVERRK
jgi:tape measure domain-containing protein|nr:MAG TPA: tail tape measure [Caudoviricetes sp.]